MPRSKKPKRAYRPKPVGVMAALTVLQQKHREDHIARNYFVAMPANEQRDEATLYSAAIAMLSHGMGTVEHARRVATMCNTALMLCEKGFGAEYEDACVEALDGVFRMDVRHRVSGQWQFDEPALHAVTRAYEVFCGQMKVAGQGHYFDATREVMRREGEGNYYRAVRIQPATEPAMESA
jgi:hypothetical protein